MKLRLALLTIAATAMAADQPYVGKWKCNLAKSDFGETTLTLESMPAGDWQSTAFGITYKFKMDGKDYPDGMGGSASWKSLDASTWQMTAKANGKVTEIDTFKLANDGKTLTDNAKMMKPDGGTLDSTVVYDRASGGPSLPGKWKTKKVSGGSNTVELVAKGNDGLVYKDLDMGMSCEGKTDGKDYPCTGPTIPPGFTLAMKSSGRSLNFDVKKDGKLFFKGTYTVAPDGKSMTEVGEPATGGEKLKLVFDRM